MKNKQLMAKRVVFNNPSTEVFWNDGTSTVVKAMESDTFDKERGILQAWFEKTSGLSKTKANKMLYEFLRMEVKPLQRKTSYTNEEFIEKLEPLLSPKLDGLEDDEIDLLAKKNAKEISDMMEVATEEQQLNLMMLMFTLMDM